MTMHDSKLRGGEQVAHGNDGIPSRQAAGFSFRPGQAIEGPFGSLTLHNNRARPAVFIARDIGITPFKSIADEATEDRLQRRLVLLYSDRRPEDAAYLAELQERERHNPNFRPITEMTSMSSSSQPWTGSQGRIDAALAKRATAGPARPIDYLADPPGMTEAMRQALNDADVDDDDIRSEEF